MDRNSLIIQPHTQTILIVDDTPTNLKVIADALSEVGYRLLIARNGESGLKRALHGKPDLILLDVMMPGIDGFETCRRLKSNPETSAIPVIFMTALTEIEHKVLGFQVGAVDYVTKPVQQAELFARVATHLQIRALTHGLEKTVTQRTQQLEATLEREKMLSQELQLALERETELNRMKTQVINVVSHEFRTPLHVIAGSTHMLSEYYEKLPVERRQVISTRIRESVHYLTGLLDDAFFVNSASQSQIEITPSKVDLINFCHEVITQIKTQYGDRDIQSTFLGCTSPMLIDEKLLKQVLVNILSNACKFSAATTPIHFTLQQHHNQLTLIVKDQGMGIPKNDLPHIFDIFQRGRNVETIRGIGLGLAITKRVVEAMGGEISAESNGENQGSTFTLTLPVTLLPTEKAASQTVPHPVSA